MIAIFTSDHQVYTSGRAKRFSSLLGSPSLIVYGSDYPDLLHESGQINTSPITLSSRISKRLRISDERKRRLIKRLQSRGIQAIIAMELALTDHLIWLAKQLKVPLIAHCRKAELQYLKSIGAKPKLDEADALIVDSNQLLKQYHPGIPGLFYPALINLYHHTAVPRKDKSRRFVISDQFETFQQPMLSLLTFRAIHERDNQFLLDVIGTGNQSDACKQVVSAWKMDDVITFHGDLESGHRNKRLASAELMIYHAANANEQIIEGVPESITEALAIGLPVAASDAYELDSLSLTGKQGLIFEAFGFERAAEMILGFLQKKEGRKPERKKTSLLPANFVKSDMRQFISAVLSVSA